MHTKEIISTILEKGTCIIPKIYCLTKISKMMCLRALIVHIFLYTSFLLTCDALEDTTINRNLKDIFRIPSTMCQNNLIEKQCNGMGATQRTSTRKDSLIKVNCSCQCKFNQTNNVFGWFDNQWKCESNSAVRNYQLSGCSLKTFKTEDSPLSTVTVKSYIRSKIVEITSDYHDCRTDGFFSYLDCKSSWKAIDGYPFYINTANKLFIYSKAFLDEKSYSSKIYGHIIKLGIRCYDIDNTYIRFCFVFKVRGQQKCLVIYPTTSTPTTAAEPSTSSKAPTTTFSTTQARPTTEKQTTTMLTTHVSTTVSITSTPLSPTKQEKTAMLTNQASITNSITSIPLFPTKQDTTEVRTRDPKLTNKTDQPQKQNRGSTDTDDDSGIIAGAIGGVAVLVAVLVILVVIWFKRKRNSPNKRTAASETVENPVYDGVVRDNSSEPPGQQTSADDEYSYAYTNTHPVVIRDQNGKALQGPHFSNGHVENIKASMDSPTSSEFPNYNTLEDPNYASLSNTKDSNSGPSYNVLERRPDAKWNTKHSASGSSPNSEAPVYNTLEDPDYAKLSKTKDRQSGPSYNVLERRPNANWNKQKGPLYDALEKTNSASGSLPNSEAPIYNTLEDPDYAKLGQSGNIRIGPSYDILEGLEDNCKRAMTQGSPFYDVLENTNSTGSPVYDVLEQPESDEQHVYGSLQNNDPHIYGALQSPTSHNGEANSGYDDDYNFAGDVIHYDGDGDVYQELNQDGQRSSDDIYEQLHHSSVLIGMKDMNEKPQSRA